ncbi:hypothetical protein NKJ06_29655 [Mesorhizobium sp. M0293]|uniref:DUF6879 family protein n=1 Tax=Mesorhizobium sp. M0293 TaxID=2956930 RepID=UPI0033367599
MMSYEQYLQTRDVSLEDFGAYFENFKQSAFRLEMLPEYDVEEEVEALAAFHAGRPTPDGFNSEWHAIVTSAAERGAKLSRIRCYKEVSDYLKFEIERGYPGNIKLGETIRYVPTAEARSVSETLGLTFLLDFWMFDGSVVFLMHYDCFGRFLGVRQTDESLVPAFITLSERLVAASSEELPG